MSIPVPLQIPKGIPRVLAADAILFATKYEESGFGRKPARTKRGTVGWREFGNTTSYPYRRRHNKWYFDGRLARFPAGLQKKTAKPVSV